MRTSPTSSFPLSSRMASALVSRLMVAAETSPSHQPLWLASSEASFKSRSMSSWIIVLTFSKGSSAMRPAISVRRPLFSEAALERSSATMRERRLSVAAFSLRTTCTAAALRRGLGGDAHLSPKVCRRTGCAVRPAALSPRRAALRVTAARICARPALPVTFSDWMIASACVRALSSLARAWVRWSHSKAFSWHLSLSCVRYCWSPKSSAEVAVRSALAVDAASTAAAFSL
mmetsp:Transcript_82267/g.212015  ORF Transcript_82267/g.212015 Transcript_82267/m.212015 type:complete len:231 (+) Transcript_82267:767-1459(+)